MDSRQKTAGASAWQRVRRALRRPADAGAREVQAHGQDDVDTAPHSIEATLGAVDLLAHVDQALHFLYISPQSLDFIGYHREYLRLLTLRDLVREEDGAALDELLSRARQSGRLESTQLTLLKSHTYPLEVELRAHWCERDGVHGYALAAFDVSAWRAREAQLLHELQHDRMTGLRNRGALDAALAEAQRIADAENSYAGLLLIDLDDYRRINRALGYLAGDTLLCETAQRLVRCLEPGMQAARVSSDKFAVLFNASTHETAVATAEMLARRIQGAVRQAYVYDARPINLSASIGIALYPESSGATRQPHHDNAFLYRADRALAMAQSANHGSFAFHERTEDPADAERLRLEADLYDGVRNGEFMLHFQPITSTRDGGVSGVEALIRWHHPTHGIVPPNEFIPLAESTGLIDYLGNWVMKAACMQLTAWQQAGIHLQFVAVNVSPRQFRDPRFERQVLDALTLSGLEPGRLVLEITENVLMHDPHHAKSLLGKLANCGIRFAIDDFGTGYSSLGYIQHLPLAKLKIDRSFIEPLLDSRRTQAIVSTVIELAHQLGLDLVAEGVETEAQRALLAEMGCDQIQGWLVCRALPAQALAERFMSGGLRVHFDPQPTLDLTA